MDKPILKTTLAYMTLIFLSCALIARSDSGTEGSKSAAMFCRGVVENTSNHQLTIPHLYIRDDLYTQRFVV